MPTIDLQHVIKNYGAASNAVDDLDLTIEDGDFMCLLGPSGCGKTTTIRMIAGLENATSGSIHIGDRVVDHPDAARFVPPERRDLGLVFQSYALWPHLSVADNIDYGLKLRKLDKAARGKRIEEVLRSLSIEDYRDRHPAQLSGGQQQRVALARMLAVQPDTMLLDEPLSNLDSRLRLEMRTELKRIHNESKSTIVFVTHDQWEAMTLATRVAVLNKGKLQQVGSPLDIYDRPANRFVANFLGVPPMNFFDFTPAGADSASAYAYLAARVDAGRLGSLGVRPEAIRVEPAAETGVTNELTLDGTVASVMPTGGSWTTDVLVGERHIYTTSSVAAPVRAGDRVTLRAAQSALHVFDQDEQRMKVETA